MFILGCEGGCTNLYNTGGREKVSQLADYLKKYIKVTGTACDDWLCLIETTRDTLNSNREAILKSDAIIVIACGGGIIAVRSLVNNIDVISGLITVGSGPEPSDSMPRMEKVDIGDWDHPICRACGKYCVAAELFGLCPENLCPLHRRDSPCSENADLHSENCVVKNNRDNKCLWWEVDRLRKRSSSFKEMKE